VKAWISKALSMPSKVMRSEEIPSTTAAAMTGWLQWAGGSLRHRRKGARSCMPHSPARENVP
jgi:hypothetical protein